MGTVVPFRTDGRLSEKTLREELRIEVVATYDEADSWAAHAQAEMREWDANITKFRQRMAKSRDEVLFLAGGDAA